MRSRGFAFTWNNYDDYAMACVMDQEYVGYRYIIVGFEKCPTTGTPHMQGFIYFDTLKDPKQVKKKLGIYVRPINGTVEQNIDYCKKVNQEGVEPNEDVYENGDPPRQGLLGKGKIDDIMKNPYENFHLYVQYRKAYRELQLAERKDHERCLYMLEEDAQYDVARTYQKNGDTVCIYPSEYDGESVYIIPIYCEDSKIRSWIRGFPPKYKNGYEMHIWDPRVVYITHERSAQELNYLIKHYNGFMTER